MKVTQEKLPASQIGLEIEISPEMSKKAYDQVIEKYMRSAQIPGFRKGKVPRQVVVQRLGTTGIKAAAVEELVQNGVQQAVAQENIEAIGNFQLRSSFDELVEQFNPGEALTFSAAVDVRPEVTLRQHTGFKVQAEETKYDPQQVEAVLEEQQSERATLIPVEDRAAQQGDVAVVDFSGHLVPEAGAESDTPTEIPGGQAEDFQIELTEGRFIEGFIDGVIGMAIGETKEVPVTFPEDYPQEDLAGQPASFTITLKELKTKELPPLDDDFAQEVSEFQTLAELRSFLEEQYQTKATQATDAKTEEALLDELVNHLEVDIPETLVTNEVNYLLTQTAMRLQGQGLDPKILFSEEMLPQLRERSRPEAITRIQRTLALAEVAKQETIQVEPQEVETRVKELLEQYRDQKVDRNRLQEVVEEDLLREKVLQWLKEHSEVELVEKLEPKAAAPDVDAPVSSEAVLDVAAEEVASEEPAS